MYKSESLFRAALVKTCRTAGAHVQPIESESTGDGIPDVYLSYAGRSAWIELKIGEVRAHAVQIAFRPGQRAWLQEERKAGRIALLGIYVPADDCSYFLHTKLEERFPYPFTEWNLKLPKLSGSIFLDWLSSL